MDLYHRISVILIHVPTLNERKEDIPILAEKFISEICEDYGMPRKSITPKGMQELQEIHWGGNIRELRNVMERLVILSEQKITDNDVLTYAVAHPTADPLEAIFNKYQHFQDFKDFMEKQFIAFKLRMNGWNVSKTADEIDIQRSHLYNKIEKYSLRREENVN
jgi:two-component system, NtrC family, nitrogen regulation response regulator NtrX